MVRLILLTLCCSNKSHTGWPKSESTEPPQTSRALVPLWTSHGPIPTNSEADPTENEGEPQAIAASQYKNDTPSAIKPITCLHSCQVLVSLSIGNAVKLFRINTDQLKYDEPNERFMGSITTSLFDFVIPGCNDDEIRGTRTKLVKNCLLPQVFPV